MLGDELVDAGGDELLHGELDLTLFRVDGQDEGFDDLADADCIGGVIEAAVGYDFADVDKAVDALGGRTFDIVYVSLGALCWLASITEWAAQVAGLLRAGGRLFLHEVHPVSQALADADLTVVYPYFEEAVPYRDTEAGTYADPTATDALPGDPTYSWNHGIGEIIGALLAAGLRIDLVDEHDWTSFQRFPWLVQTGEEEFVVPDGHLRVPLSFTLVASRN